MRQSEPSVDVITCVPPGLLLLEFGKCSYPVNGEALGPCFSTYLADGSLKSYVAY